MTRYSGASGLVYGTYGTGVYGTGDIPDLRLSRFEVRPTNAFGTYVDADGQPVFGRATVTWGFRANITPKVKLLRSTKGFATSHQDNFSTVIAATDYPINLLGASVDQYGWTGITTSEPHFLKSGDEVTFSGVPVPTQDAGGSLLTSWDGSPLVDGTWVVSVVRSPTSFGLRQNHKPLPAGTTAMVYAPGSDLYTATYLDTYGSPLPAPSSACGALATPSLSRLASDRTWVTDTSVVLGTEYYYSLWVADPTVAGLWVFGGEKAHLAPKDHGSIARIFDALPPYLTNVNYGSALQPLIDVMPDTDTLVPGAPTTAKFLAGLAWVWDDILTHVDKVRRVWDVSSMPVALLGSAVATFGLPDEPTFGARSRRALVQDAQYLSASRGTGKGLAAFVEALVGLPASVTVGQNLMLSTDCSSFVYGTGSWSATNASLGLVSAPTLAVPASTYYVTNTATAITGVLDTPKSLALTATTAANVVASLAGGVPNLTLTVPESVAYVSVVTGGTHGLEVGDRVTISGATAYNVSGTVSAVQSATQYTLVPTSGTLVKGSGTGGVSGYTASSLVNPFAITQGIPVSARSSYLLSFSACASVTAKTVAASVSWWDAQGRFLSTASVLGSTAMTTSLVQQTPAATLAPVGAAYLTIDLTFGGAATGTVFYLDGVMLTLSTGLATFEDARTVTISMDASPASVASNADMRTVVKARLVDNLQNQLPVGTAFVLKINTVSL